MRKPKVLLLTDFLYRSKDGSLPFDADIELKFTLKPEEPGTILTVNQSGFPDDIADEFYNLCVQGWIDTLTSIKNVVEERK